MNIREFTKPVSAKKLNESLAQRFGAKIDLDKFTTEQLQDVRNKIRTKLSQVQTTESFDSVQKEDYQKNKLFLDVLNAALSERGSVAEAIDEAIRALTGSEQTPTANLGVGVHLFTADNVPADGKAEPAYISAFDLKA